MTIDSHHHFWKYNPGEYAWIGEDMSVIRRDFLPPDLKQVIAAANVDAVISVQARQTLDETRWLLDLAASNDFIAGVVGWVPLVSPTAFDDLAALLALPRGAGKKLKSLRHVLQAEPDEKYMLRDRFTTVLRQLAPLNLAYDILILERQLPQTIEFVDRHPNQTFILDHLAKPRIKEWIMSPWREQIRELARRENVYAKISGMVTEADYRAWSGEQLRPYVDVALEAFGPKRLMFGSDWPVCTLAASYDQVVDAARQSLDDIGVLNDASETAIFGGTAAHWYGLPR